MFVAIRELGPTLTWVGLVLLAIGAASAALLIFSPAHRRLRTLEQAARALGEGRTDVRAIEGGGDEVSTLAHTFNRMADDLGARAEALAASDRARRQLLADVSHELMTPLAAIRGYTETLAMPELCLDAPTRSRYLGIIGDETQKLESLIGDLLDLARLEGGGGTLTFEEVPVRELFSRIADRHGPAIRDRRHHARRLRQAAGPDRRRRRDSGSNRRCRISRPTPCGTRRKVDGCRSQPRRRHDGTRDHRAGQRARHSARTPAPCLRAFLQGGRGPKRDAAMSGSGLGLSIVQAIVERHGGTVTAANAADGGAVFEIRIPRPDHPQSD